MKLIKILINASNGMYSFVRVDYLGPNIAPQILATAVLVPESTIQMWQAIDRANHDVQEQLKALIKDSKEK